MLGVHSRCGLHTRAVTVFRDPLSEGFRHFVASMPAPVASGWSESPGGPRTHWKAPPCHGAPPFQPLAALHPVQTWEDTKLLLVHALGHVRDLIPRSIRVIANGPLAPFVQCYAGRRAERPAQPRVASSGSTDRSADVIRHRHRQQ